jgi:hypothetical protein
VRRVERELVVNCFEAADPEGDVERGAEGERDLLHPVHPRDELGLVLGFGDDVAIDRGGIRQALTPVVEPGPPLVARVDCGSDSVQVVEKPVEISRMCAARVAR